MSDTATSFSSWKCPKHCWAAMIRPKSVSFLCHHGCHYLQFLHTGFLKLTYLLCFILSVHISVHQGDQRSTIPKTKVRR